MDILEINEEKKYVRCEPMVSVQRLFEALQAKGYDVQYRPSSIYILVTGSNNQIRIYGSAEFSGIFYPIIFDENHSKMDFYHLKLVVGSVEQDKTRNFVYQSDWL